MKKHYKEKAVIRVTESLKHLVARERHQIMKVAFWDIKDHTDDLKKNSIA
jgi:hypothetical protein